MLYLQVWLYSHMVDFNFNIFIEGSTLQRIGSEKSENFIILRKVQAWRGSSRLRVMKSNPGIKYKTDIFLYNIS